MGCWSMAKGLTEQSPKLERMAIEGCVDGEEYVLIEVLAWRMEMVG